MDINKVLKYNFPIISDEYRKFALEKDKCRKCYIHTNYNQVCQSEGNAKNPVFVFVGEAPGSDEIKEMRPFIGAAGQRLRMELRKYKDVFTKENALITNTISCRPQGNVYPGDSDPGVKTCVDSWLNRELTLLKPKIIVLLGGAALSAVRRETGITANRGKWKFLSPGTTNLDENGNVKKYVKVPSFFSHLKAWTLATFHPSYVIRCESEGNTYVGNLFSQDIESVATMYKTLLSDYRYTAKNELFSQDSKYNKYHTPKGGLGNLGLSLTGEQMAQQLGLISGGAQAKFPY